MFEKRLRIFIGLSLLILAVCIGRLAQMQFLDRSAVERAVRSLKEEWSKSSQFTTARGRILDRKGRVLAVDEPRFYLHISYRLSSILDERVRRAAQGAATPAKDETAEGLQSRLDEINIVMDKCTAFNMSREEIERRLGELNDRMWNLRSFVAWVRAEPDPNLLAQYSGRVNSIPFWRAMEDFKKGFSSEEEQLQAVRAVDDLRDLNTSIALLELHEDDDVFAAQVEFLGVNGVEIMPQAVRDYPYGPVACHVIGWVGPAKNPAYRELFADEPLASYLEDDICGRDGAEYVCEAILRGRRGGVTYDIDKNVISRAPPQFGGDVGLTLDIELQKTIEEMLVDPNVNPLSKNDSAAVVLDVPTGDVLVLASQPRFDLNRVLEDYPRIYDYNNSSPQLWRSRAMNTPYPPGSVAKPLILVAGLEAGAIRADEVIPCPAAPAPQGWPNCLIWLRHRTGHGESNSARSALKGSCNVYFSRLADRISPRGLQRVLWDFGYGHAATPPPLVSRAPDNVRNFRQSPGIIASRFAVGPMQTFEDIPPLDASERRRFGIGQGNLRVTPLQVASAMATLARGGVSKPPRLLLPQAGVLDTQTTEAVNLHINVGTIDVVHDGMYAVVHEPGGTAYNAFAGRELASASVKLYGKTGSTQDPECAWFAGFAADSSGRELAIAVLIDGGQSGSNDAAPVAREVLKRCIEYGYIGNGPAR